MASSKPPRRRKGILPSGPQRVQRILAAAGFGSRRTCEELIVAGRVAIDGEVVFELGTQVDPDAQEIAVDGLSIRPSRPKHYLLNKPVGVLCTNNDPDGRPLVIDLFTREDARLFTVGRLDEGTEGLLIVTNDGELAHRLAHPSFEVQRIYQALVAGDLSQETMGQLKRGLYFSDGKFRVDAIRRVRKHKNSTLIEMRLSEGKNREIRRLLARVGHKVLRLRRVAFGPLKLGNTLPGQYRALRRDEVEQLYAYEPVARETEASDTRPRSRSAARGSGLKPRTSKKSAASPNRPPRRPGAGNPQTRRPDSKPKARRKRS